MVPDSPHLCITTDPAPRTRGDGPWLRSTGPLPSICSPHPRGWSLGELARLDRKTLLPAPAGMVPTAAGRPAAPPAAPRTRGDGPYKDA
ncbi:hypothetical protein EASAB2608_06534 [Streptomyces sp. EAS-AB2608]|nr:hypothetical protein EASAB2608_06534 [Streptomyces sp. EAS-AB2608]